MPFGVLFFLFSNVLSAFDIRYVQVAERAEIDMKEDIMKSYSYPSMTRTQTRGKEKFI